MLIFKLKPVFKLVALGLTVFGCWTIIKLLLQ